jgi:hypothetical protein
MFGDLLLSTVSLLKQTSRPSNNFDFIPEKYELVESLLLNNIIPYYVFTSRCIRKKVDQAISEVSSRSFKTISKKAIIQVLLDNHHIILENIVSTNNDLVYLINN